MKKQDILYIILITLIFLNFVYSQTNSQKEWLMKFSEEQAILFNKRHAEAESIAIKQNMPIRKEYASGIIIELQYFENGIPIYNITESNLNAAKTISTDKVWPGGSGGFSLTGLTDTLGIWDGGKVRGTHQELIGRIIFGDGASTLSDHATHVAGTMIASGVVSTAKGMSYEGKLRGYDWNNAESEMSAAAANGLRVSNHSYGIITGWYWNYFNDNRWAWFGNPAISEVEDYGFGFYSSEAQVWDQISYNAPYYLIVNSSGNNRGEGPTGGVEHWVRISGSWTLVTAQRDKDGGSSGFDCIGYRGNAKNILTVGAVNIISGGYTVPGSVVMSSFSGWGPTDDGRIKPDVVGAGVNLYSSIATSDNAYDVYSGTSMSTPNISGSIGLLLQHQKNLYGNVPLRSSTIKGLIIHTADEAGAYNGPDYIFGWGLMNTLKAVQLMTSNKNSGNSFNIRELTLNNNDSIIVNVPVKGNQPLRATICWTDPAGTPPSPSLDPPNLMLKNDLDMRISNSNTTYYPWVLDPANPGAAASTGDNFRDNVEQIHIQTPIKDLYTLKIRHKGTLSGGSQVVSLLISGGQNIVLAYPNGGENFHVGSKQTLKWYTQNYTGNVKIELTRNAGATYETIFESTPNDGNEDWTVTGPTATNCRIRITYLDLPNSNDYNNNFFSITQAAISLDSPNGGELWDTDSVKTISWSSSNLPGKIKIEITRDNGLTYETLFDSTGNDGIENWIVTPPATDYAKIKISSVYIPSLFDLSDDVFTIVAPFIKVIQPQDRMSMIVDSIYEIKWSTYKAADFLNIELSRDGGLTYEPIITNTTNDGSEFWIATGPVTDKAIIRISNASSPELYGYSKGYFTIGNIYHVSYNEKWNLVSIPVKTAENRKSILFHSAISNAFKYVPAIGYELSNELDRMKGYWLKFPENITESFIGVQFLEDSLDLFVGWNLIGAISTPVSIDALITDPPGLQNGYIYSYNNKYEIVDTIYPGRAYWFQSGATGKLFINSNKILTKSVQRTNLADFYNSIKIISKSGDYQTLYFTSQKIDQTFSFDLPPVPPSSAFDVRFSSNKILETFEEKTKVTKKLEYQNLEFPITLKWNIKDGNEYIIYDEGENTIYLSNTGITQIQKVNGNKFYLSNNADTKNTKSIEYSLSQNYPNPFNPKTKIIFSLPKSDYATIKVYNILGNEIATLYNGIAEGGKYIEVDFDASQIPSGIYFYKLKSGGNVLVNKMIVMK